MHASRAQRAFPAGHLHARISSFLGGVRGMRVLVVGCGGIGCELVKCLACILDERREAGEGVVPGLPDEIHLVDLDSIDVTNLNRQFLFQMEHVNRSKALVTAEVLRGKFGPSANLRFFPYHKNVMDRSFDRAWFSRFAVVLNALDNVDARRHVNRMCIAACVPLVDSGTAGFNGQVMPILPRRSRCFDCAPPARQRGFPVCTIRSAPSKPEHCVAWAKFLFELVFGPEDASNLLADLKESLKSLERNGEGVDVGANGLPGLEGCRSSDGCAETGPGWSGAESPSESAGDGGARAGDSGCAPSGGAGNGRDAAVADGKAGRAAAVRRSVNFSQELFSQVFERDIRRDAELLRTSAEFRQGDRLPEPLPTAELLARLPTTVDAASAAFFNLDKQSVLPLPAVAGHFTTAVRRILDLRPSAVGSLTFNKDDEDAALFVAAAASLRMANFNIARISYFACESIAGAIIPAVASTNAVVAAVQVQQGLRIQQLYAEKTPDELSKWTLQDFKDRGHVQHVWCAAVPHGSYSLLAETLEPPRSTCIVCQTSILEIEASDLTRATLEDLIRSLESALECVSNEQLSVELCSTGICIYSQELLEDDDDFEPVKVKMSLEEWGLFDGCTLAVTSDQAAGEEAAGLGGLQCTVFISSPASSMTDGELGAVRAPATKLTSRWIHKGTHLRTAAVLSAGDDTVPQEAQFQSPRKKQGNRSVTKGTADDAVDLSDDEGVETEDGGRSNSGGTNAAAGDAADVCCLDCDDDDED